jgi:hypothetical protein
LISDTLSPLVIAPAAAPLLVWVHVIGAVPPTLKSILALELTTVVGAVVTETLGATIGGVGVTSSVTVARTFVRPGFLALNFPDAASAPRLSSIVTLRAEMEQRERSSLRALRLLAHLAAMRSPSTVRLTNRPTRFDDLKAARFRESRLGSVTESLDIFVLVGATMSTRNLTRLPLDVVLVVVLGEAAAEATCGANHATAINSESVAMTVVRAVRIEVGRVSSGMNQVSLPCERLSTRGEAPHLG